MFDLLVKLIRVLHLKLFYTEGIVLNFTLPNNSH